MEAARQLGEEIESVCGGAGSCGKCLVQIKHELSSDSAVSVLNEVEQEYLNKEMLSQNYRLACQVHIYEDVTVVIPEASQRIIQQIRKEIDFNIEHVNPVIRTYYIDIKSEAISNFTGEWEILKAALHNQIRVEAESIDINALRDLQKMTREGDGRITLSIRGKEVIRVAAGKHEYCYGLAVDMGTTTMAGYLCELSGGSRIATHSIVNPQVPYGEDVMARIHFVMTHKDGLEILHEVLISGINEIAKVIIDKAGITIDDLIEIVLVGNTCMHHLALNISPEYLGLYPFTPAVQEAMNIKARDLGIAANRGAYIYVLPIEAGFVGADNVGVLISQQPYKQDQYQLIIDIGTNGEIILGNKNRLLSCSCATGPAFEGAEIKFGMRASEGAIEKIKIDIKTKEVCFKVIGQDKWNDEREGIKARGICGSGILDAVSQLYLAGIIEYNGRYTKYDSSPRLRGNGAEREFVLVWASDTVIGQDITVTQKDVRNIQLAKGALAAGAKVLLERIGRDKPEQVILAGAFGSYIDPNSAANLGLFPDCLHNIKAVGNAAGSGACLALLDQAARQEAEMIARKVEYIELTSVRKFQKYFTESLWFPPLNTD